jgi:hypothetical protein
MKDTKPIIAAIVSVISAILTALGVDLGDQGAIVDQINAGVTAIIMLVSAIIAAWLKLRKKEDQQ